MASNLVATSPAGVPWRSRNVFLMQIASAKIFQSHNFYFRYSSFKIVLHTCWRIALVSGCYSGESPTSAFWEICLANMAERRRAECLPGCLAGDQRPETGDRRLFTFRCCCCCCHFPRQSPIHKEGRPEWAGPQITANINDISYDCQIPDSILI